MPFVYILKCADGSLYVGSTADLDQRLERHNQGGASQYTPCRRPVELRYSEEFPSLADGSRARATDQALEFREEACVD